LCLCDWGKFGVPWACVLFVKVRTLDSGYSVAVLSWPRAFHEVTQFFMHGAYATGNSNLDFRQSFNVGVLNLVGVSKGLVISFSLKFIVQVSYHG
jgi:hypothetical protein